jgi:hypothetical protein
MASLSRRDAGCDEHQVEMIASFDARDRPGAGDERSDTEIEW